MRTNASELFPIPSGRRNPDDKHGWQSVRERWNARDGDPRPGRDWRRCTTWAVGLLIPVTPDGHRAVDDLGQRAAGVCGTVEREECTGRDDPGRRRKQGGQCLRDDDHPMLTGGSEPGITILSGGAYVDRRPGAPTALGPARGSPPRPPVWPADSTVLTRPPMSSCYGTSPHAGSCCRSMSPGPARPGTVSSSLNGSIAACPGSTRGGGPWRSGR